MRCVSSPCLISSSARVPVPSQDKSKVNMNKFLQEAIKAFGTRSTRRKANNDDALARLVALMFSPSLAGEMDLWFKGATRNELEANLQKKGPFDRYGHAGQGRLPDACPPILRNLPDSLQLGRHRTSPRRRMQCLRTRFTIEWRIGSHGLHSQRQQPPRRSLRCQQLVLVSGRNYSCIHTLSVHTLSDSPPVGGAQPATRRPGDVQALKPVSQADAHRDVDGDPARSGCVELELRGNDAVRGTTRLCAVGRL